MGPRIHQSFCACKTALLAPELLVSLGPSTHLLFLDAKQVFWSRITNLYGSQTSLVVLCMQNIVISIRIISFFGSQQSSVVFGCKTAPFGQEITSLHGSQTSPFVLCMQNSVISTSFTSLCGSQPSSVVYARKTGTFGP